MSRNKLRVSLTGFSIAFGIFMLIVLLAAGNGLLHGMARMFGPNPNKMQLWGGWTSKEWHGQARSRRIALDIESVQRLVERHRDVIDFWVPVVERSVTVSCGRHHTTLQLCGVTDSFTGLSDGELIAGRWLNVTDHAERRKVIALDRETAELLLGVSMRGGTKRAEDIIGQWVQVSDLSFQVIGLYKPRVNFSHEQQAYTAFSTMAAIYAGSDRSMSTVHLSLRGLDTPEKNADFAKLLNTTMASIEDYDPTDQGIWIWNKAEDYLEHENMMRGMRLLIWVIGVASLFAGVVGVSNIMLITVRERTREFGIRKAIGASPRSIIMLVITEAVAITLLFGYIGMFLGIALSQFAATMLAAAPQGEGPQVFVNPTVDIGIVIGANIIMVLAGLIAGYVPARRAAKIKPVVALNSD